MMLDASTDSGPESQASSKNAAHATLSPRSPLGLSWSFFMMTIDLRERIGGPDPAFRSFFSLLVLATAVPMLAMPITHRWHPDATSVLALAGLLTFAGGPAHVSLTTWFYGDPVARAHFRTSPLRYLWAPAAIIVGSTAMYAIWGMGTPTRWLNLVFSGWLLWHYQRQNWGIQSFVSRVVTGESASTLELWILRFAVVGGFLAAIEVVGFGDGTIVRTYKNEIFWLGAAISSAVPILVAVAVATNARLRSSPARLGFLLVASAFFLPVFLFRDFQSAFLTYALAHGLQYAVFMGYMATSTHGAVTSVHRPGVPALLLCVVTVGVLLQLAGDASLLIATNAIPLYGLGLGITMAHFVVDAGIWRLRDEFPRRYVGAAFPFLGPRSPATGHDG